MARMLQFMYGIIWFALGADRRYGVRVDLAVLADYATVTDDKKLVIVGVFDSILAKSFPALHPSMYVALRICLGPADNGDHTLSLRIVDPDGHTVAPELKANFTVNAPLNDDQEGALQLVMGMGNMKFEVCGPYAVYILIDDRYEETVSLSLRLQRA